MTEQISNGEEDTGYSWDPLWKDNDCQAVRLLPRRNQCTKNPEVGNVTNDSTQDKRFWFLLFKPRN